MRIIVIKLPACISRFLLRLRGEYEPEYYIPPPPHRFYRNYGRGR